MGCPCLNRNLKKEILAMTDQKISSALSYKTLSGPGLIDASTVTYEGALRTVQTNVKEWLDRTFYAVDFGVIADGIADNTATIEVISSIVDSLGGGKIIYPHGVVGVMSKIDIDNLSYPQIHIGQGKKATVFKFVQQSGTLGAMFEVVNCDYFGFSAMTLDCNYEVLQNGGHGIVTFNCGYPLFDEIEVLDYKDTGILDYTDKPGEIVGGLMRDCNTYDAQGNANNGLSFEDKWFVGYINCIASGARGSPGYGIQFKNQCKYFFAQNTIAINCTAGHALGQTLSSSAESMQGGSDGVISGQSIGCQLGFDAGYATDVKVDLLIDQQLQGAEAFKISNSSKNITGRINALNVNRSVNAVRISGGQNINVVADIITGGNAKLVRFENGVTGCNVEIKKIEFFDATKNITAITQAAEGVLTITSHGYANGSLIYIAGIVGMTPLNNSTYTVSVVDANNIKLLKLSGNFVNTLSFPAYISGGVVAKTSAESANLVPPDSITNDSSGNTTNQVRYLSQNLYSVSVSPLSVASASVTDLTKQNNEIVLITGTNSINALTLPKGAKRFIKFENALTLVGSASLILPGGQDIITAPGDTALFVAESDGVVRCNYYTAAANPVISNSVDESSAINVLDSVITTVAFIFLPPGNYLVSANPCFTATTLTATSMQAFFGSTPLPSFTGRDPYNTSYINPPPAGASTTLSATISTPVFSGAGGVYVYLKVLSFFSAGTIAAFGGISAVRIPN